MISSRFPSGNALRLFLSNSMEIPQGIYRAIPAETLIKNAKGTTRYIPLNLNRSSEKVSKIQIRFL